MTVWSGEFRFAAEHTSFPAARLQTSATTACDRPMMAAIAPTPAGTASCMYVPRWRTSCTASASVSAPAATSAEYSPRLCPATKSGVKPFSASARKTATEQLKIAGCVLAVSLRSSSVPSKHIREREKPSALSASLKTALAAGYRSANSLPIPGYCEACPGNTNATLPILNSSLEPSDEDARGRELLFDFLVHAGAGQPRGHADGVFHGVGVRTSMPNHANAAHTQQRRSAVLRVVNGLLQPLEGPLGEQRTHLRKDGTPQRLPEQPKNRNRQPFANFQRDVSHETIANDHVDVAGKKIAAFDVSDKLHRALLQPRIYLAGQLVPLAFFLTDREQPHARPLVAKRRSIINLADHRKLNQILRLPVHIRAHIT